MMVGRLVDWFRQWFVTSARYRAALKTRRLGLEELIIRDKERLAAAKFWKELLEEVRTEKQDLTQALDDERTRFSDEEQNKDLEIEQFKLDIRLLKSDLAVAERDKENLIGSNELARAQNEAMQAGCSAQKTKYLMEESRPSIGGLL